MSNTTATENRAVLKSPWDKNLWVFGMLWLVTFILYLPAVKAGWVIDSAGWLHNVRNMRFLDYLNNTQSVIPSLYQFTELTTYLFYRIFNANPYAWHGMMVTMHALNAFLFYSICRQLFVDSGIKNSREIAISGVILFTICPHISEVIVWEAAFHYLQGFLLILLILFWVQKYHHQPEKKYIWLAGLTYFCSSYSLEIFYLTPWFVLTLTLYYRLALDYEKAILKRTILWFFIPQLLIFALHITLMQLVYQGKMAHLGENVWQPFSTYICKAPRYVFHILLLGRYWPLDVRTQVYLIVGSTQGLIIFYNVIVLVWCYLVSRARLMQGIGRTGMLLFAWVMIAMIIIMPLNFPVIQSVVYDRYTYFLDAFIFMLLAVLVSNIPNKFFRIFLLSAYGVINLFFTLNVNLLWKHSAYITNRLLKELPNPGNRTVLLLNLPQNMDGVPMIGADPDGQYKIMRELFVDKSIPNKIYDVAAYNMITEKDGAHVTVINDSILKVTLNQWGTWWWYEAHGAMSYENADYRVDMRDMGHWYDLKIKHPSSQYMILYSAGDKWKEVDWKKKNEDEY